MKKVLVMLAMLLPLAAFAQNTQCKCTGCNQELTKYETLTTKTTGTLMKIVDVDVNRMLVSSGSLETYIRKVSCGKDTYFFRLEKKGLSSAPSEEAMIEYSDLVEINKAMETMISEIQANKAIKSENIDYKYITEDGFEVGYTMFKRGEPRWYLKLCRYSDNVVNVSSKDNIQKAFKAAQAKIEELKAGK